MRIVATVLNADGTVVGDGPLVTLKSASVTRALDGAGSIQIDVPGTDRRAVELLQNKRRIIAYTLQPDNSLRELGRGIIDDIDRNDTAGGWTMSASGPDILAELKYTNTLFNRSYNQKTISEISSGLIGIMTEWGWTGWSATASGTALLISARYDAATVLKAMQQLVSQQGLHLRLAASGKGVEIGAFGADAGLTIISPKQAPPEIYQNDDAALIERIKLKTSSEDIMTWMLPLAGGDNVDSALSLQYSNRTTPYPILTMIGPDGRSLKYIQKQSAIDKYGIIPKVGTFKDIAPLSNTDTDIRNAANATYDAAVAQLERYSEPLEAYSLTVRKCVKTIRPGDKVHIQYQGEIEDEDGVFKYRDIDADFWVMRATERFGLEGGTLDLDVSSIDRYPSSEGTFIMNGLEKISIQGINVQPNFVLAPYGPYQRDIDSTHAINVPLRIRDSVFELSRCLLQIKSTPFRSNAKSVTFHDHLVARVNDGTPAGAMVVRRYTFLEQTTGNLIHADISTDAGAAPVFLQTAVSGTTSLDYGIYDDTVYPANITVKVDGVTVASGLDPSGTGLDFEMDIAAQLRTNLRSTHTINITCASGQGEMEVSFELYPNITPFKLGT